MDLKSNQNGVYLKISERNGTNRSSVLIPSSGIHRLAEVLQEISRSKELKESTRASDDKGVRYSSIVYYYYCLVFCTPHQPTVLHNFPPLSPQPSSRRTRWQRGS